MREVLAMLPTHILLVCHSDLNPFKPEFTILISIHYKPRLVVDKDDLKWVVNEKKLSLLLKQCHKLFVSKPVALGN